MLRDRQALPGFLLLLPDRIKAFSLDDQHTFSFGFLLLIESQRPGKSRRKSGLMLFRQLPADRQPPVSQRFLKLRKSPHEPVRRLVNNHGPGFFLQLRQHQLPVLFLRRKKSLKAETAGRKSGERQRCNAGAGPGKGSHRHALLLADPHQILPRIGNSRRPCVGDQGDILPFFQFFHKHMGFFDPVVFVIAGHRRMNIEMVQKLDAVSRILRRDQVHLF